GHPGGAAHREAAAPVVFGGGAPEGGPGGAPDPLGPAVQPQGAQARLGVGELQGEPVAPHPQVDVPLDDGEGAAGAQGGQPEGRRGPGVAVVVGGAVGGGVVPVAQVLHGGLFRAVGKNDAVGAEGVVGGALAKVAAVAQAAAPGALLPQGL